MNSLISIIIPAFNQAEYIDECIDCVVRQSYSNWECIIINDGSTDNTKEKVKFWTEKDSRIKYIEKKNSGVCNTKNVGLTQANGEWILPLDADDLISDDYLMLASQYFHQDNIKIIYCEAELFEGKTGRWVLPEFSHEEFVQNNMIFNSAFFRKTDGLAVGGYDERLIYGMEDWDFWISILKNGGDVVRISKVCFFYRIKNGSRSQSLQRETYDHCFKIIDKKHFDYFEKYLPPYHRLLFDNRDLQKVLNSRKYRLINKLFNLIGR